jgi:ribonuclease HI
MLLRVYRALMLFKVDYGSFVYGFAKKFKLSLIDPVHNTGLRLTTGALSISRLQSLYAEAGEPPLNVRRKLLLCSYVARLTTQPAHPTHRAAFRPSFHCRYDFLTSAPRHVGVRLQDLLQRLGIQLPHFIPHRLSPVPAWKSPQPVCDLRLARYAGGATSALTYRRHFAELLSHYPDHTAVYTHGSFLQGSARSAFVYNGQAFSYRLHSFNSAFTAELYALYRAVLFICRQLGRHHLVRTDSLSALPCLSHYCPDHPTVAEILLQVSNLHTSGQSVMFCWVPGHCGLPGNEAAIAVTIAAAMRGPLVSDRAQSTDVCSCLRRAILSSWQAQWDSALGNKFRMVKPSVQEWQSSVRALKKDEVTLACLRIGHSRGGRTVVTGRACARLYTLCSPP